MAKIDIFAEMRDQVMKDRSPATMLAFVDQPAAQYAQQITDELVEALTPYTSSLCMPFLLMSLRVVFDALSSADPNSASLAKELLRDMAAVTLVAKQGCAGEEAAQCKP